MTHVGIRFIGGFGWLTEKAGPVQTFSALTVNDISRAFMEAEALQMYDERYASLHFLIIHLHLVFL